MSYSSKFIKNILNLFCLSPILNHKNQLLFVQKLPGFPLKKPLPHRTWDKSQNKLLNA